MADQALRRHGRTVYATFLPTFLYIFVGAPYIEWLSGNVVLPEQARFDVRTRCRAGL